MTEVPPQISPTVDAIWAARLAEAAARPQYEGYGISASELGQECDRRMFYTLRWTSPPEQMTGRKLRIFERGDIEEERVIADLRRAGLDVLDRDPDTGRQFSFTLANGWLRGKADGRAWGFIEAPKAEHVIEIKSLKAADWRAIEKHGLRAKKPEHWHQLHTGMLGLGVNRGAYIGVNKDTEEILIERVHLDQEEGNRQEARVLRAVAAHEAPQRISEKPDFFTCRFCPHHAHCHTGTDARRHCRSCLHFSFGDGGNGHCDRFDKPLKPAEQRAGATCPAHLYLPSLVHGEQIDADPEAETVTYRKPDGSIWIDGQQENTPCNS